MNIRRRCYKIYWRLQSVIAPSLKYSQTIYEEILRKYSTAKKYWLDLGCGHQLLPPWRADQEREVVQHVKLLVGLDYDFKSLMKHKTIHHRIQGDISVLHFADNCFDLVTSNMVIEHLKEPKTQLAEVFRVLKPGGILIFHTPNILGYDTTIARLAPKPLIGKLIYFFQSRKEEDVFPAYYRLNSHNSIKKAAISIGFQIKHIRLIVSTAQLVMIPPLVILELMFIRALMTGYCKPFRTNIIAILQKPNFE